VKILTIIPQSEKAEADEFYQEISISRYKRLTPQEVYQASQTAIKVIMNHDKYGFVDGKIDAERINRKTQLNEAIDYFYNNQDKTYFIIAQLPELVPEDAKTMFAASKAFQEIIAAGSNIKLEEFSMALMRRFRLTRADIKDDYAQSKRLFGKYYMKPIISRNLTPLPPFPTREWGFQSLSPTRGEVWRGFYLYIKNFSNILLL
jgi:hypothetical protein